MSAATAYERFVRPLLFSLDPETAHHLAINALCAASALPTALAPLRRFQPERNEVSAFGLTFPNPVGLAAGFDKNGVALSGWEALGFGFVEIGTVTARAQPGNPKPRIFRYPEQQALINRLGFNNDGADVIADRLAKLRASGRWPRIPVGINIGKSKVAQLKNAPEDYLYSFRKLREFADYVVLNVSSPNTPGLRALQEQQALADLLHVDSAGEPRIAHAGPSEDRARSDNGRPRADHHDLRAERDCRADRHEHDARSLIDPDGARSDRRVERRARCAKNRPRFIRAIKERSRLPIIGVGGIMDAASAREKFEAGATLIQVYTGFIYRGPGLLREIAAAR